MKYLILMLLPLASLATEEDDMVNKMYTEKKVFFKSCMADKTAYYKCDLLWSGKDKGCTSGVSFGSALGAGAAAGAASSVVRGLLK